MSRSTIIFVLINALLLVVASDETQKKHLKIMLTDDDIVSGTNLARLSPNEQEIGFIGDLIIGKRRADETIYRRTVRVTNYENYVGFFAMELSANTGVVHYLSVVNNHDSRAVACDTPYTLGASISSFIVRVLPRSESVLSVFVATHPE